MDAGIIIVAAIVGASIVGAFIMMSRRGAETGEDTGELVRLAEEKAKAESELASTRADLDTANQMLNDARQFEIQNAKLSTDLANEQALHERVSGELKTTQSRRDTLQAQVQNLTAEISGLKAELTNRDRTSSELATEKDSLTVQRKDLQNQVNELLTTVSKLETQLKGAEGRLGERDDVEKRFLDAFKSLSSDVLKAQGETFRSNADASLKARQEAVEKLVKPLNEQIVKLEEARAASTGALGNELQRLSEQTNNLTTAMSRPEFRGRWAEIQVERVLELSGLKRGIDYETQYVDDQGTRPDFVVRMPNERVLVLDSKISLPALQKAAGAANENDRKQALEEHAMQVRQHADQLGMKAYWNNLEASPEFVVMVIPDFAYQPAVERDSELLDRALDRKVIIVTPHMLFALLQVVERNWREQRSRENLEEVLVRGKELYERLGVVANHIKGLGGSLETTLGRYNTVVGSWDRRIAPTITRFQELDVRVGDEPPELEEIDVDEYEPRVLQRELGDIS